jgi:UDP-N-acetyl-D-mannosaminuronic acid transferase (WecB/TagA/CpsF family)
MELVTVLGVHFLNCGADQGVEEVSRSGGVLTVPAAPAMVRLRHDSIYREAMARADYAIADSGLMVLSWRLLRRERLQRVSGLAHLNSLVRRPEFHASGQVFCVLPSEAARAKLVAWGNSQGFIIGESDCYVAPHYALAVEDPKLLELVSQRKPRHIITAIGNGPQEKLGVYLRDRLPYRPAIHCIGAALGFLTGDQVGIPAWADRFYLGWLLRLFAQPQIFIPRLTRAAILPWLVIRYGRQMPPLARKD